MEVEGEILMSLCSIHGVVLPRGRRSNDDGGSGGCLFIMAGKKLFDGNGVRTTELGELAMIVYFQVYRQNRYLKNRRNFFGGPVDLESIPVSISILITQANPPSPLTIGTWQEIIPTVLP